jgi:hypothetical protein
MANGMQAIASEPPIIRRSRSRPILRDGEDDSRPSRPRRRWKSRPLHAKSAYEGFVAQATRMSELYADMAKEIYKPFEGRHRQGQVSSIDATRGAERWPGRRWRPGLFRDRDDAGAGVGFKFVVIVRWPYCQHE